MPAPSAIIIAVMVDDPTRAAIYAFDTGATLLDGTTKAPARRVHFPGSDNTFAALNADGLKLFDAAVTWAANLTVKPPVPALAVARTATGLTLTFTGTLQAAASVTGPWADVGNASSPLAVTPAGPGKFYRAKQ